MKSELPSDLTDQPSRDAASPVGASATSESLTRDVTRHEIFMSRALELARQAHDAGEVPVGAVIVKDGAIIAQGFNTPIGSNDPTAHAEIVAMRAAAQALGSYRLLNTTLYVTLEPCAMCAGAMVHARVQQLVYAASDLRAGACGSIFNIAQHTALNHRIAIESGVLAEQSVSLLRNFFIARR